MQILKKLHKLCIIRTEPLKRKINILVLNARSLITYDSKIIIFKWSSTQKINH